MRELLVLVVFILVGLWAWGADADSRCNPLKEGQEKIKASGEVAVFIAMSMRGHITQISMNPKTGNWTAAYITNEKMLCLADYGSDAKLGLPSTRVTYD
tara:strand:+ start:7724 stop:8020 length:297 start_codon:yes stop_codon:yes gene_type:complete